MLCLCFNCDVYSFLKAFAFMKSTLKCIFINITCRSPPTGQVKPPASCTCPANSYDLAGSIPTANREDIQKRRAEEYKKHQARYAWPPVPGTKDGIKG